MRACKSNSSASKPPPPSTPIRRLRERRDRPCGCRTSNYFDKLAPPHRHAPGALDKGIVAVELRAVKECLMSALGQKRTFGPKNAMYALPPIANIVEHDRDVRFVPKADSCTAAKRSLFDHFIGPGEQCRRNF